MSRIDRLLEPGRLLKGALVGEMLQEKLALRELPPGHQLGAFRIVRELGRGGMGIVYLAMRDDGAYEQQVAIKWSPVGEKIRGQTGAFRRERQILAGLRHPHIARILDGGCSEDGHLWFAMEHVDGQPVDRHVAQAGMGWRDCVRLLLPVVDAVQFAHAHLWVHRDIKPDNVLVDEDGCAMLVDFGIAAMLSGAEAQPAYTDGFASPEQCAGAAADVADDIWQLGNLLRVVLSANAAGDAPARLPADLRAVLDRATQTQAASRYDHVAALHADLKCLLESRPVSVRRPGPWHRLCLLGRAHPLGMLASVLAVTAFVLLTAGFMLRLAHQRDAAQHARVTAEAVNAFLLDDFLPGADPLQGGSGDIPVAQLAVRALDRAEPRLQTLPEVAARVELGLARTLANLGHFKSAGEAFDKAIGHLEQLGGKQDVRVLRARLQRQHYSQDPDRLAGGREALHKLRADVVSSLGKQAPLLVKVDNERARVAYLRGDFTACGRQYKALLPRLTRVDDVTRADVWRGLSMCESRLGEGHAALQHARAARQLVASTLGPQHPYTLEGGLAVETVLTGLGRYGQAVAMLRRLVDSLGRRYGQDHPVTLYAMHDLGFALTCDGHAQEGLTWLQRAVDSRARVLGPAHPWTAMSESVSGMALIQLHRLEPARHMLQKARTTLGSRASDLPYVYAVLLENEADLALAGGHGRQALARYDQALAAARELYPADHPRLAVLALSRGLALAETGEKVQGRALMRRSLQQLGTRPDCRGRQRLRAERLLASRP